MLVDNTDKLKDVMVFNPQKSYYKFIALIRAKDYKDGSTSVLTNKEKQEVFIRQWLVDSEEVLEKALPDMLTVTEMFKCRLYMTTDRKSTVKTMMNVRKVMEECLDQFVMNPNAQVSVKMLNKVVPSATSVSESSDNEKRWLFDVDTKAEEVLQTVVKLCEEHYLATFETKNGYHVLANRKFDARKTLTEASVESVELKDNALVLVAMGG